MSIVYSTTLKNTRLDAVTTAVGTSGLLVIGTSALSGATGVLATITLAATMAGAASGGVLTFSGTPLSNAASATGTAAKAELRTSGGTVVASGLTVGTSSSDVIITNTSVTSGQTVTLTSATITHG